MKAREENLLELASLVNGDAIRLQAIARALHRLDEAACNYGLSTRQEQRGHRLETQARLLAEAYDLSVYRQGDPRGWPLYIGGPDMDNSNYPERGTGVYPQ